MSEFICNFCNSKFLNKHNLNTHIKNAKFCLEIQNKQNIDIKEHNKSDKSFSCKYCNKVYSRKDNLTRHMKDCKIKDITDVNTVKQNYENLNKDHEELKQEKFELKSKLKELEKYIIFEKLYQEEVRRNTQLQDRYNKLEDDYKKFVETNTVTIKENVKSIEKLASKAIEHAGNKTTINNSNRIYQQLVPLTNDYMREQSRYLELKHVMNGAEGLAYFAKEYSLKDRVICTDVARRNFVFKDEIGTIIKDPKGVKITKKFIETNKAELIRLLKNYALTYYDDDTTMSLKDKQEIDECLYAVERENIPANLDSYSNFEKQFTVCFSKLVPGTNKLVYNKNDINDDIEEETSIQELE